MKQYNFDDLNLPKVNLNEDLETISNNFFRPLFDLKKFEIRSENLRDKGIDFHIELKKEQISGDSVYTNFRFAVQLKATESIDSNNDGSFSIQISSSNINYLLNNGMPAYYVFFHKQTNSFYYESINNFFSDLQKKDANWNNQEKHSLRFYKLLNDTSILEIYNETFNNGILIRNLNQHLKFTVKDEKLGAILIDQNNEVYSVAENIAYLDQFGHELINGQHFGFIIGIEQRTHPRPEATPKFNLISGIAYFQHGNLYKAIELLKLAQQKSDFFEPESQTMLTYTLLNAKFLLGIMSKENFDNEILKITQDPISGTFFEIEKAYQELSSNKVKQAEGIKMFYSSINDIVEKDEKNANLRINAYAKILDAEAIILFNDLEINFSYFIGRVNEPLKTKSYLEWLELEKIYLERLDKLTEFALENRYFLAVSNLASSKIVWKYKKIYYSHLLDNWKIKEFQLDKTLNPKDMKLLVECCDKLDKIFGTYEMLEHRENMISCLNNKYEILHFIGNSEAALEAKTKILDIIENNDFAGLKIRHEEITNGKTSHEKFIKNYTTRINGIQELAAKCGIDVFNDFSEDLLLARTPEWSINRFLEFNFPEIENSI